MPINTGEIISLVQHLAEDRNLSVTVKQSLKGASIAGGCAFVGGLVGGPLGLAVGGIVGSVGAAWRGSGKFKPVAHVIMYDMTSAQRQQLANSVQNVIANVHTEDLIMLTSLVMGSPSMQQLVLTELGRFLQSEMGLAINL